MIGYIRDPRTWTAVKTVTVTIYELPIETAQGETGKATIVGQLDADYSRYFLTLENDTDKVFVITGQQAGTLEATTITLSDCLGILGGNVGSVPEAREFVDENFLLNSGGLRPNLSGLFSNFFSTSQTGYVLGLFTTGENFKPATLGLKVSRNALNRLRAIQIPAESFSRILVPEATTTSIGPLYVYNREEVLREIRNNGFPVTLTDELYNRASYKVYEVGDPYSTQVVPLADGHSELLSESYKDDICSVVYVTKESFGTAAEKPFSIFELDGENGHTTIVERDSENYSTAQEQADAIFSQNKHSHKIEFASDRELHIGQPVKLMLSRGVLDTVISKVMLKSGDDRFIYTCGELPVTATERIKADGWSYGSRLPANPRKGQIFIMED